jgi:hypothetical protein
MDLVVFSRLSKEFANATNGQRVACSDEAASAPGIAALSMCLQVGQAAAQAVLSVLRHQGDNHVSGLKARISARDEHSSAATDGRDQALRWKVQLSKGLPHCPVAVLQPELDNVLARPLIKPGPVHVRQSCFLVDTGVRIGPYDVTAT